MIREREMVLDCLESCKVDTVRFTEAAAESSDPNLRQTLKQLRDQVENSHQQVHQIASQHGWYQNPSPANPQEVQRIRSHFAGTTQQGQAQQYGGYGGQYGAGGYAATGQYGGTGAQYGGVQGQYGGTGAGYGQQYGGAQYGQQYGGGQYGSSQSALRQPTAQPGQSGQTYGSQYPTTGQTQGWSPASPGGATYTGRRY